MIAVSLTACGNQPVEPLVFAEATPRAALTLEQAKPYKCQPVVFSPEVPGDYVKTLKVTLLDYMTAYLKCFQQDGDVIDLATRKPGTPDPAATPPGK